MQKLILVLLIFGVSVIAEQITIGNAGEGDYYCSGGVGPYYSRYTLYSAGNCYSSQNNCDPNCIYGGNEIVSQTDLPSGNIQNAEICIRVAKYNSDENEIIIYINENHICTKKELPIDDLICCTIDPMHLQTGLNQISISTNEAIHVVAKTDGLEVTNWCGATSNKIAAAITLNYLDPSPSPNPTPSPTPSPTPTPTPNPTPTSSPTPSASPSPSPSPTPSPEPTPSPTPTATPTPTVIPTPTPVATVSVEPSEPATGQTETKGTGYHPSLEPSPEPSTAFFVEDEIDIIVGDELFVGFNEVLVLANGEPAKGQILFERNGASFERKLASDGGITFYFDEPDAWTITFQNSTKEVSVKSQDSDPTLPELPTESSAEDRVGLATGLFTAAEVDWHWLILLAMTTLIAWLTYENFWRTVAITKKVNGKHVTIQMKNRGPAARNLTLIAALPESANLTSYSEEPMEIKDTINGLVITWRRNALANGEAWHLKYAVEQKAEQNTVELKYELEDGKKKLKFG